MELISQAEARAHGLKPLTSSYLCTRCGRDQSGQLKSKIRELEGQGVKLQLVRGGRKPDEKLNIQIWTKQPERKKDASDPGGVWVETGRASR